MIRLAAALVGAGLGFVLAGAIAILAAPAPASTWAGTLVLGCAFLGSQFDWRPRRGRVHR